MSKRIRRAFEASETQFDGKTLKVTSKIKLTGHPNNISISADGKRVYVAIREEKGAVDVIDTVVPVVVDTGRIHPPLNVPAPIRTGSAGVFAYGEGDSPPRPS